jgi:hypothetical protein
MVQEYLQRLHHHQLQHPEEIQQKTESYKHSPEIQLKNQIFQYLTVMVHYTQHSENLVKYMQITGEHLKAYSKHSTQKFQEHEKFNHESYQQKHQKYKSHTDIYEEHTNAIKNAQITRLRRSQETHTRNYHKNDIVDIYRHTNPPLQTVHYTPKMKVTLTTRYASTPC